MLHSGVGAITESDIGLARSLGRAGHWLQCACQCTRPVNAANQKGVEIRYYSVIYELVDDVKAAMLSGLLSAEVRENFIGYAEIKRGLQ